MKIYAINGGPRKRWNTAKMLQHFVDGVHSVAPEAEVETVHLFDLKYKGCISCFACKRPGDSYAKCEVKDDIYDLLRNVTQADGVILASPIYFSNITAQLRGFLERLWFPLHSFERGESSIAPKTVYSALIYTMNLTEEHIIRDGYKEQLKNTEDYMEYHFHSAPQILYAFNTYQFDDYSKYKASYWDVEDKAKWREEQFPIDLKKSFDAGAHMALQIMSQQ